MSAPSPKPIKSTPGRENPEHAFAVHSEEPLKEGNSTRVIGRNLFFDPPGAQRSDPREEPDKRRVYAAIEVPEFGDGPKDGVPSEEPVFLECIDAAWFDVVLLDPTKRSWVDLFREVPLLVLELTEYALPAYPAGAQPGDIAWYEFAFEAVDPSESDARAYTGLYADGAAVRITSHEQRPMGWTDTGPMGPGGWLAQIMRSQPRDSEPQELLRSALSTVDCRGGVAVYDVGQGACQAALDGSLHLPSLYVDFGGGVLTNRKTFSDELAAFCFSRRPIVLLSHWDWDHWSSAYRHGGVHVRAMVRPACSADAHPAGLCRGPLHERIAAPVGRFMAGNHP